ncbi:MAG TPA: tetratricopeptide repeat protein [Polyangiaceae bacterium]|nr:tetratricopeptide repeat protein [Polyangiaceae bacterium]
MRYEHPKMGFRRSVLRGLLAFVCWAGPAFAEPTTEAVRMARKRFQEGVAAADLGNYEGARVAFQQAYALKPHASVLRNLGQAELKTSHFVEAARHLSLFLRDTTFGSVADREAAKKSLAQAESKVGKVTVDVDVDGADVTVDGELVGRSPLADPVYIEAGRRLLRVSKDGHTPYEQPQMLEPGRPAQVKVLLRSRVEVLPSATEAASISRTTGSSTTLPRIDDFVELSPHEGLGPPPQGLKSTPDAKPSTRAVVRVVAGALTIVSVGVAVGFGLKGSSLRAHEEDVRASLREEPGPAGSVCSLAANGAACSDLADTAERRASANKIARVGGVAAGVFALGLGATFLFWSDATSPSAKLVPHVSPTHAGLVLEGAFR